MSGSKPKISLPIADRVLLHRWAHYNSRHRPISPEGHCSLGVQSEAPQAELQAAARLHS